MHDDGFYAAIAIAEQASADAAAGRVRIAAVDWRKDWRGPGEHSSVFAIQQYPYGYNRDLAIFGTMREMYALGSDATDVARYGSNADVFTTAVFRHPEYRDAIRNHDPRTVFDDGTGPDWRGGPVGRYAVYGESAYGSELIGTGPTLSGVVPILEHWRDTTTGTRRGYIVDRTNGRTVEEREGW